MNTKLISLVSVLILFSGAAVLSFSDMSEGSDSFTITDGTGEIFEYDRPTEHIVTMGYASTLTVAMLGNIDKIIATDSYSTYDYTKDERLKDLEAENMGSIYSSSNNDKIATQFIQWVESGDMNLDDTIILTTYSNAKVLRETLNREGFTNVLVYLTITDYEQIIDFVESMSLIVTGKTSKIVDDMRHVKETIDDGLKDVETKAKGLGVWYTASSGAFTVGNTGSITVSLIEAAGGENIAYDPSKGSPTYGDVSTIIQKMEANRDAVIFLPNSYIKDHTIAEFRNTVLGGDTSIRILGMEQNWNNYCPDAMEGLWAFACAMYPDIFEGDVPITDDAPPSNLMLYIVAGIVVLGIALVAAFFVMRRP